MISAARRWSASSPARLSVELSVELLVELWVELSARTGRVVGGCAICGRLLGGRRRSRRIGRGLSKQRRPAVVAAQLSVVEQANSAVHAVVAGGSDYFLFAQPRHRLGH